jgi:hypothetical protein
MNVGFTHQIKKNSHLPYNGLFSQPRQFFSHGSGFLSRTFCSPVRLSLQSSNDSFFSARLFLTALFEADCYGSLYAANSAQSKLSHELLLEAAASSQTLTTVRSPRSDTTMSGQRQRNTEIHTTNGDSIEHTAEWLQCLIL